MKLVFDDNRSYEAFQIIWIGFMKSRLLAKTLDRLSLLHGLMTRLSAVSHSEGEKQL